MSVRGKKQTKVEEVVEQPEVEMKGGKPAKTSRAGAKSAPKKTTKTAGKKPAGSKTAKKAPAKGKKTAGKQRGGESPKERYFKLIDAKSGKSFGRYIGGTPKQAASKGYTKMLQKLRANGEKVPTRSVIYLRESTRGSARKVYGYEATRQKLSEPQELVITDKETGKNKTITYNFRNRIKKVPVNENVHNVLTGGAKAKVSKKASGSKSAKKSSPKTAGKKTASKPAKKTAGSKTAKKTTKAKASSSR